MRTRAFVGVAATVAFAAALVTGPANSAGADTARPSHTGALQQYVVLYEAGADDALARAAVAAAGGTVLSSNAAVGYAVAESRASDFSLRAARADVLVGAARNRSIGTAPTRERPSRQEVERLSADRAAALSTSADAAPSVAAGVEPLADRQWDMKQIGATAKGSYAVQRGKKGVLVGVIDTGVDGSHPDIAPNFDRGLSRNFTRDMPDIDNGEDADGDGKGDEPCEHVGCVDPADVDDNDHGTHVASTIGSPINGVGIGGVAPDVTLVNIRAGQDSGYFFLQPTLDALVYAGDIGVDVVNMSFYVDPWLYNCTDLPGDSEAEQAEQRTVRQAVQRAVTYARNKGVLPVAAAGNGATDLGKPVFDGSSPDYPVGSERDRNIDNSCITVPTETRGVVAVTSTGISGRKAYYSDYGTEQADVAAPGGDTYDTPDQRRDVTRAVLAAYPKALAKARGELDATGKPVVDYVVRDCTGGNGCSFYTYLQGTSMASPHAAGVAALLVSEHGSKDPAHPGLTLAPARTEGLLSGTAVDHRCPAGGVQDYRRLLSDGTVATATHRCEGTVERNGFYGEGIVNALRAVR